MSRSASSRLPPMAALLLVLGLAGCGMPKDPEGTTERILASHVLRAGASENPPWVRFRGGAVEGIEPALIERFARTLGAQVEWVRGGETPLLEALEKRQLDLVAAGITTDTPWKSRIGLTQSYAQTGRKGRDRHALPSAPGENQLLLRLDGFLHDERAQVEALVAAQQGRP